MPRVKPVDPRKKFFSELRLRTQGARRENVQIVPQVPEPLEVGSSEVLLGKINSKMIALRAALRTVADQGHDEKLVFFTDVSDQKYLKGYQRLLYRRLQKEGWSPALIPCSVDGPKEEGTVYKVIISFDQYLD